ncbi:MAG: hypothetical protein JJ858_10690 [Rhizobiaceae bacterium]|nr:hypothetical protein [Rhizobiaceae bacterium]
MSLPASIEVIRDYEEYTDAFLSQEVDANDFSHLDHVCVAREIILRFDFLMAVQIFSESIHSMAMNAGASDKFNLTVTLAFMSIISERMQSGEDLEGFVKTNQDLLHTDFMEAYYTKDRLNSSKAKGIFLMPDKKGVPTSGEGE